jgi:1-deoxy-D-xylulose-5-phosphate reductoisomerase
VGSDVKSLSILGSTGSIGTQALDIVRAHPREFKVVALAAGKNTDLLAQQVLEFNPQLVSVNQSTDVIALKNKLPRFSGEILSGAIGLNAVATHAAADTVLAAVVGTTSLEPTLAAILAKKNIALANKELLVSAGTLIMQAVRENGVMLLPVDSEHSALMQALNPKINQGVLEYPTAQLQRLIITASGGPFRNLSREQIQTQKAAAALKHPNWNMGKKITIDSATLMNKGLEVIEAHHLFGVPFEKIDVLVHPQSIIHSLAEFMDGSVLAQMGVPDMRTPIQYALTFPEHLKNDFPKLDLLKNSPLTFELPDFEKFPNLKLAYEAGNKGGSMPAVMNAANEAAVYLYLEDKISFYEISQYVSQKMKAHTWVENPTLQQILEADKFGRDL